MRFSKINTEKKENLQLRRKWTATENRTRCCRLSVWYKRNYWKSFLNCYTVSLVFLLKFFCIYLDGFLFVDYVWIHLKLPCYLLAKRFGCQASVTYVITPFTSFSLSAKHNLLNCGEVIIKYYNLGLSFFEIYVNIWGDIKTPLMVLSRCKMQLFIKYFALTWGQQFPSLVWTICRCGV